MASHCQEERGALRCVWVCVYACGCVCMWVCVYACGCVHVGACLCVSVMYILHNDGRPLYQCQGKLGALKRSLEEVCFVFK